MLLKGILKRVNVLALTLFSFLHVTAQKTVTFPSKDGLLITADIYEENPDYPYLLLCHQARSSRGEFIETAKCFNKLGFNCLAVDLRSGHHINEIRNETAALATVKGLTPSYLDAQQDIEASIDWLLKNKTNGHKLYALGSSYSASLLAVIGVRNNFLKGLILFSPGEYFDGKISVKKEATNLTTPCLVLSNSFESPYTKEIFSINKSAALFAPQKGGEHGAKAIWAKAEHHQEYWIAVISFLEKVKRK